MAMQPVLLQHNCGRTAFPFESCRSPRLAGSNLGPRRSEAAEFFPRTNVLLDAVNERVANPKIM